MRTERILSIVLTTLLLAFVTTLSVMPAVAQQAGIPCDDGDNTLTRTELVNAILPYMLKNDGAHTLDEVGDAAWVYAYWCGVPKTTMDTSGATVTLYKPIERAVVLNSDFAEVLVVLDKRDIVVGITTTITTYTRFYPEISTKTDVGGWYTPDVEAILAAHPDAIFTYVQYPSTSELNDKLPEGINVIRMDFYRVATQRDEMVKVGDLLDRTELRDQYLVWHDQYVDEIYARVAEISDENKTRMFIDGGDPKSKLVTQRRAYSTGTGMHDLCVYAGGIDITEGYATSPYSNIDTEWILNETPDVIVGITYAGGYETDDNSEMKAQYDTIKAIPGFDPGVPAVVNDKVYIMSNAYAFSPHYPAPLAQMAKWLYPANFTDFDPDAIHQEYVDQFLGTGYNVDTQGVHVYP